MAAAGGGVALLSHTTGVPLSAFTRDPAEIFGFPSYAGILSNLGICGWAAATGVWLLGASLTGAPFLWASGLATAWLTLDDLFLFHEDLLPRGGVPQGLVQVGYLAGAAVYAVAFRHSLARGPRLPLLLTALALGLSLGLDAFLPFSDTEAFWEDLLKFAGIVFWLTFTNLTVARWLRP